MLAPKEKCRKRKNLRALAQRGLSQGCGSHEEDRHRWRERTETFTNDHPRQDCLVLLDRQAAAMLPEPNRITDDEEQAVDIRTHDRVPVVSPTARLGDRPRSTCAMSSSICSSVLQNMPCSGRPKSFASVPPPMIEVRQRAPSKLPRQISRFHMARSPGPRRNHGHAGLLSKRARPSDDRHPNFFRNPVPGADFQPRSHP